MTYVYLQRKPGEESPDEGEGKAKKKRGFGIDIKAPKISFGLGGGKKRTKPEGAADTSSSDSEGEASKREQNAEIVYFAQKMCWRLSFERTELRSRMRNRGAKDGK